MLRRLHSKHGFTLVEVLVAFVIFAIMAGMVGVILNTTMKAKQNNIDVEEAIENQKQSYYLKNQPISQDDYNDFKDETGAYTGTISLDFKKNTKTGTTNVGNTSIDFVNADPNKDEDDVELEYYIGEDGNDKWQATVSSEGGDGSQGSTEIFGNLDCWIYGTARTDSVRIGIEPKEVGGKTRYYIYYYPETSYNIDEDLNLFSQVRIRFPSSITKFGYCNKNNGNDLDYKNNDLTVVDLNTPGDSCVLRVSGDGNSRQIFDASDGKPSFWVELSSPLTSEEIADPTKIFGDSGLNDVTRSTMTGITGATVNLVEFYQYRVADDPSTDEENDPKTYVNIFGAKPKDDGGEDTP